MLFYCDIMLGRLSKYLRILGIDTAYSRYSGIEDIIKKSTAQERIILTKRKLTPKLSNRQNIFIVSSNHPEEQLKEVIRNFGLGKNHIKPFSLCLKCNRQLIRIEKKGLHGRVPDYIYNTNVYFSTCPCCNKIYWPGSHLKNMKERLTVLFNKSVNHV